jgi:hypothetical protein
MINHLKYNCKYTLFPGRAKAFTKISRRRSRKPIKAAKTKEKSRRR